jgi:hypothetical protein
MFTFQPLQGVQTGSTASQSILELDGGVKVLVDVGWEESFDPRQLVKLEKYGRIVLPGFDLTLIDTSQLYPSYS